ncbi:hypothetical protein NGA_2119500, partial [Nannochloropsis gaditana CCMP526]
HRMRGAAKDLPSEFWMGVPERRRRDSEGISFNSL